MNGMFCPCGSIVIFESLSERVCGDTHNGIHLRVEGFGTPKGVNRDAILFYLVNRPFEVLFADKS